MTETPSYSPFRASTFSAIERLLCSFLIESLTSTPLGSIIYVCRASMMLPQKEQDTLKIDLDEVNNIFTIAQRLQSVVKNEKGGKVFYYQIDFQSLNYEKYLTPWMRMTAYDYYISKEAKSSQDDKEDELIEKLGDNEKTVYSCKRLTEMGYEHLCADFLLYATPLSQQWAGLLTGLISPDTYTDMLRTYKGAYGDRG